MISWNKHLYSLGVGIVIIGLTAFAGVNLYQPPQKTDKIYKEAFEAYQNKEYSKSYALFSKIVFTSNLKPLAMYRQGVDADLLEDRNSAIKQYKFFLLLYPKHTLANRVRYNLAAAQLKVNPVEAKRTFESIIANSPDTDYAIASEYYSGLIDLRKYEKEKIFPLSVKNEIQNHFRHYLKKAPSGRLALSVAYDWENMDAEISKEDYLLMAKSYYLFKDYKKAAELCKKSELKNSWAFEVKNSAALGDSGRAKYLTEWGLNGNADYVDGKDVEDAIDIYMAMMPSKYQAAIHLMGLTKSRGKDYLMNIKCSYSPNSEKTECFRNMYLWFPKSQYVDKAQAQIFINLVSHNDIYNAQKIGNAFLNKYKDSSEYAPMVMYYMGVANESARSYKDYVGFYRSVLAKYPDNYYAYRAYLKLRHNSSPIIVSYIKEQPIEFPYERSHKFFDKLIEFKDFEILDEYTSYDSFLKSWVLYQKGENSHAMLVARNAMDNLKVKPDKNDKKWRLVYPIFYYDEIKDASNKAGTNAPLMLALTREESYFNPKAESPAGAKGLMQLMPATAQSTASQRGIGNYDLFNPKQNILLGNYHYSIVKSQLNGLDVSSIAAYNGGVGAVNTWKSTISYHDTDSFIEQIPYPETKLYVKKVLRSYWNYIRIYEGNG